MKTFIKHITSVYLIAFVLLSSIAVPYSAMTCLISDNTSWTIMTEMQECTADRENSNNVGIEKPSCCLFNNGVIDIDSDLVIQEFNEFVSFLPFTASYSALYNFTIKPHSEVYAFFPKHPNQVPARIAYQSFLC